MAKKRMFKQSVVETDKFYDLSESAQTLYFHLGMTADDDGVLDSYKRTVRAISNGESALQELVDNDYLIQDERFGKCLVIRHWRVNNNKIDNDRYECEHPEIMELLDSQKLKPYELKTNSKKGSRSVGELRVNKMGTKCAQNVDIMCPQSRVDKNRLDKSSVGRYPEDEKPTPDASIVTYQSPIKTQKEKHGNHVLLTPIEYDMLIEKYGKEETQERIAVLDKAIQRKPESYEKIKDNHFEQLQKRWIDDGIKEERAKRSSNAKDQKPSIPNYKQRDYDFDELAERLRKTDTP